MGDEEGWKRAVKAAKAGSALNCSGSCCSSLAMGKAQVRRPGWAGRQEADGAFWLDRHSRGAGGGAALLRRLGGSQNGWSGAATEAAFPATAGYQQPVACSRYLPLHRQRLGAARVSAGLCGCVGRVEVRSPQRPPATPVQASRPALHLAPRLPGRVDPGSPRARVAQDLALPGGVGVGGKRRGSSLLPRFPCGVLPGVAGT